MIARPPAWRGWRWTYIVVVVLSGLACSTAPAGEGERSEDSPSATADLRLGLDMQRTADGVPRLSVVLRNVGDVPVTIDATNTPFETPLSADVFEVLHGNEPVVYLGRLVKRAGEETARTFTLAPDEGRVAEIDLAAHYALTPGARHVVSPRRIVLDGMVRQAGLPGVSVSPPDGVSFVP